MPAAHPRTTRTATRTLLALAAVGLVSCGPAADDDPQAALAERDARIEDLQAEVAELEAEIERLRGEEPAPTPPGDEPATPRTPEGLVDQLRAYFPPDPALGFAPAPTPWEDAEVPEGFGEGQAGFDSAGALMTALAGQLSGGRLGTDVWEATTRVLYDPPEAGADAASAQGAVLLWGFLDDAAAGSDHRFTLERGEGGWFVAGAQQRTRCSRGVTDDGLCV